MPLRAVMLTIPPRQKYWRCMICHRCSVRSGSSPISRVERSSTAPVTARVFHSRVASPQPHRPGSLVSTFTKIQLRIRAFTTSVEIPVIRIGLHRKYQKSAAETHHHLALVGFECVWRSDQVLAWVFLHHGPLF